MASEQYAGINSGRAARAASRRGQNTPSRSSAGSDVPF